MHVHVYCADGEAKYWLEPQIELAQNYGLNARQIRAAQDLIRKHEDDIRNAWHKHTAEDEHCEGPTTSTRLAASFKVGSTFLS